MPVTEDERLRSLLELEPIAVVGCSGTPGKAAHDIPAYMQAQGRAVIPVNPFHDELLGRRTYDSLSDVDEAVALVDVFRPSEEVPDIVDEVLARKDERGDVEALWLQLGITHDEAAARAEEAGLDVVQDRCWKVEHGRLL